MNSPDQILVYKIRFIVLFSTIESMMSFLSDMIWYRYLVTYSYRCQYTIPTDVLKPEFTGNAFLIEDPDLMGPILSRKSWWIDQFPNLTRPSDLEQNKNRAYQGVYQGVSV